MPTAEYSTYAQKSTILTLAQRNPSFAEFYSQYQDQIVLSAPLPIDLWGDVLAIAEKEGHDADKLYKEEGDAFAKKNYGADIKTLEKNYGADTVKDTIQLNLLLMKVRDVVCENVEMKKGSAPTTAAPTTKASETEKATEKTTDKETTAAETTK